VTIYQHNAVPWLLINPEKWDNSTQTSTSVPLPDIINNVENIQDTYYSLIKSLAENAVTYRAPAIVSWYNEGNGNWYNHSAPQSGIETVQAFNQTLFSIAEKVKQDVPGAERYLITASDFNGRSFPDESWNHPVNHGMNEADLQSAHEYAKREGETIANLINSYALTALQGLTDGRIAIGETACADTVNQEECYRSLDGLSTQIGLIVFFNFTEFWDENFLGPGTGRFVDYAITDSAGNVRPVVKQVLTAGDFATAYQRH
jgi:hypothetical protein